MSPLEWLVDGAAELVVAWRENRTLAQISRRAWALVAVAVGVCVIALSTLIAGCSSGGGGVSDSQMHMDYNDFYVTVRDGRTVYCIQVNPGISCDWANAKATT
ncbi:Uncharacterised protein [Mycobacteroides abscessus subsp. bolletii]|nr:Uncharacterised protein [Mycobacteroides abscessus subsp. bolletii]SKS05309.1 Uncharacterised protein [Mycobacteroides abscessus subsp. abscessus]SHW63229.1 Uncharacterised protein [Mycobacteroides abscessus subsp. bolletii]SHW91277.1 Uncharacterised protein [Mycobacteroides abscessus subsp. bolletii]SHX33928.1 Uncharacterised protein [Mycobacteroides abscessus subsp. bolletii]